MRVTICTQITSLSPSQPVLKNLSITLHNTSQISVLTWSSENEQDTISDFVKGSPVFLDGNEIRDAKTFENINIVDAMCQSEDGQGECDIAIESITFEDNETQIIIEQPYSVYGKKIG